MEGKIKLKKNPHPTSKPTIIWCYNLPCSNYLNHVRRQPWSHKCSLLAVGPALAEEGAGVGGRGQVKGSLAQRQIVAPWERRGTLAQSFSFSLFWIKPHPIIS